MTYVIDQLRRSAEARQLAREALKVVIRFVEPKVLSKTEYFHGPLDMIDLAAGANAITCLDQALLRWYITDVFQENDCVSLMRWVRLNVTDACQFETIDQNRTAYAVAFLCDLDRRLAEGTP